MGNASLSGGQVCQMQYMPKQIKSHCLSVFKVMQPLVEITESMSKMLRVGARFTTAFSDSRKYCRLISPLNSDTLQFSLLY